MEEECKPDCFYGFCCRKSVNYDSSITAVQAATRICLHIKEQKLVECKQCPFGLGDVPSCVHAEQKSLEGNECFVNGSIDLSDHQKHF